MIAAKGYAAHVAGAELEPWNFERRDISFHDVHFKIKYCGVCHSDLHQVRNDWGGSKFPMVPGHEIVGEVIAVGPLVTKFKVGDLAGTGCMVDTCRICSNCKEGIEQYCLNGVSWTYNSKERNGMPTYGGYSDSIVVHEDFVLHMPANLDLAATAPLLCAGITTYSPLMHWNVGMGHKLGVIGLGGLGHMAVKFGVALGAEVTVLSTSASKQHDALELGAHHFVNTKYSRLDELKNNFDFILDTVSAPHDLTMYLSMLKTQGTHICVGLPDKPMQIPAFSLTGGRKSIAGSGIGSIKETQEMLDFCAANNITSNIELISIQHIEQAFNRMIAGDVKYRFVLDMASL